MIIVHKINTIAMAIGAFSMFAIPATVYAQQAMPTASPQILRAIDEHDRVAALGNTRPEAIPANDRGRVPDDFEMANMQLVLRRPAAQEQAFESVIDAMYTPGSATFHHWLTANAIGAQFGPAEADVGTVTRWLASHGFQVNTIYPSRMVIDFSGTAGQVRETFATEIHNLDVDGVHHVANMSDPSFPAALAPVITGIASLHDFRPRSMREPRPMYTYGPKGGKTYALVPADMATIYNLSPLFTAGITGKGQTVVAIEDTDLYKTSDFTTFRSKFGLTAYTSGSLTTIHPAPPTGTNNCKNPGVANGDDGEAALDVEWAGAAAPDAAIVLASCADTNTSDGLLVAMQNLTNAASPLPIVTISYGECEAEDGVAENAGWYDIDEQAAAEGVSVFVSAGDQEAASCDAGAHKATHGIGVSGFASTPYNVAVGGTDFGDTYAGSSSKYWNTTNTGVYGSAKSYINEIPWNDSCASQLSASFNGSTVTYGSTGFCNTSIASSEDYLIVAGGSGGPSGCATGKPAKGGIVGGTCKGYPKPLWQAGLFGNPADGVRDIPDVALFAANGVWNHYYVDCWSNVAEGGLSCSGAPSTWDGGGGTSFSSPILAGIQALINQKTGTNQGNPNPVYYLLAATEYGAKGSSACDSSRGKSVGSACVFYDVRQGDMDVNCTGTVDCYRPSGTNGVLSTTDTAYKPAYGAKAGWDFATGIGTINAYNLVNAWPTGG
jgi:subtilase family serine protease